MSAREAAPYSTWSNSALIARIDELEAQLKISNAQQPPRSTHSKDDPSLVQEPANTFDPLRYRTRHIALKIAYLGQNYSGYEHANGNLTPLPTIEEVLWKAMRKACLIWPPTDEPAEATRSFAERSRKPFHISWDGCQYSKCGRTDRGVSAFGQVIGIRVRSNQLSESAASARKDVEVEGEVIESKNITPFDPIEDELPYISMLNSLLPSDIRVLAWCPNPPDGFDARYSCGERRYKYFFTNPAFLPTTGPIGISDAQGHDTGLREGWLDIEAMKEAAKRLVGLHDYRNFCRVDVSKQLGTFERRLTHVSIEEVKAQSGPLFSSEQNHLARDSSTKNPTQELHNNLETTGPKVFTINFHGTAFLWHQVRYMVAVLFLVGQRLESASVIDQLLDVEKNPCRPTYEMAADTPLVLWDCIFPKDRASDQDDELDWIYAGDACTLAGLNTKSDGKFSRAGVVDEAWSIWRKHKMDETLSSTLLDLVVSQGDSSAFHRGGATEVKKSARRSQKVFDGSQTARLVGKYIPIMQKPRMATVDVQKTRHRDGKAIRQNLRRTQKVNDQVPESDQLASAFV